MECTLESDYIRTVILCLPFLLRLQVEWWIDFVTLQGINKFLTNMHFLYTAFWSDTRLLSLKTTHGRSISEIKLRSFSFYGKNNAFFAVVGKYLQYST